MKTNPQVWARIVALAVFMSANIFCVSCFAQADPLNSWTQVWSNNPVLLSVSSVAYGNGMFLGTGNGGMLISYNGSNWNTLTGPPIFTGSPGVAFGAGTFVMFGTNTQSNANYIFSSTDGTSWTNIYSSSNTLTAAAYGNSVWVFVGTNNEIVTATLTSSNWNWTNFQPAFSPISVTYANGDFVILGLSRYYFPSFVVLSSSDGIDWQYDSTFSFTNYYGGLAVSAAGITYGNGVYVTSIIQSGDIVGNDFFSENEGFVSSNLLQWNAAWDIQTNFAFATTQAIAFGGGQFVGSFLGNILTSVDGFNWTNRSSGLINSFAYGQGAFIAAASYPSAIYQSGSFDSSNSAPTILSISTYPGVTINGAAGSVYQIQYTTNLTSAWQPLTNFSLPYSPFIWIDTSSSVVGQRFYRSVQLQ
jgi:hypothetical protein